MELGRGGFESLLEHNSKAQLPLCILWYPFTQLDMRMEAGQCKCLWFQSSVDGNNPIVTRQFVLGDS
jgi:hypothetical protein